MPMSQGKGEKKQAGVEPVLYNRVCSIRDGATSRCLVDSAYRRILLDDLLAFLAIVIISHANSGFQWSIFIRASARP